MKSFIQHFLFPLLVLLAGGIILYQYQSDKPDLRYNLSQRLPISFASSVSESIQLLDIKNVGESEASGITIKANRSITKFEIQKYSKSDTVTTNIEGEPFEVKYNSLPPSGEFKIIIQSAGEGLNASELSITHSKGKASDVFKSNKSWIFALFLWGCLALLLIGLLSNIKDSLTSWWERKITYDPDRIIKAKKPFFFNDEKWTKLRHEAWQAAIVKDITLHYKNPLDGMSYYTLQADKPDYFHQEEWKATRQKATDILIATIRIYCNSIYSLDKFTDLASLQKTDNMTNESWGEVRKAIIDGLESVTARVTRNYSASELLGALESKQFQNDEALRSAYNKVIEKKYKFSVVSSLYYQKRPYSSLNSVKLDIFERYEREIIEKSAYDVELSNALRDLIFSAGSDFKPEETETFTNKDQQLLQDIAYQLQYSALLEKIRLWAKDPSSAIDNKWVSALKESDVRVISLIAYQHCLLELYPLSGSQSAQKLLNMKKPDWVDIIDFEWLSHIAEDVVKLEADRKHYSYLKSYLNSILMDSYCGETKPEYLEDEEFTQLQILANEFMRARKKNQVSVARNHINLKKTEEIKKKLQFQLSVINQFITDPTVISRIEEYENSFAPGNFENLKMLSNLLTSKNIT